LRTWGPWLAIAAAIGLAVLLLSMTSPSDSARSKSETEKTVSNQTNPALNNPSSETVDAAMLSGFQPTKENIDRPKDSAPLGMVWIPGGEFSMGSDHRSESLCGLPGITNDAVPIHRVYVDGFWMDATEVTNAQFREFVEATGYVTVAEIKPTAEEFPTAPPENLIAGSTVFRPTNGPVEFDNYLQWWSYVPGADWRHPTGVDSSIDGRDEYPVVQVAYEDAEAYAKWAKKRLPTEAEWEFAARGGKSGQLYAWGNEIKLDGEYQANIYQGRFPVSGGDSALDGFAGIAPIQKYPANPYGLFDMGGNVWEWVSDWYRHDYYARLHSTGKVTRNPKGPEDSLDPIEPDQKKRVHRGGSFLCSDLYCTRYMVGTRGKGEVRTASNHCGFRCVKDRAATGTR
jgi:formylglycine-generating enzyme required for sulfatase activity